MRSAITTITVALAVGCSPPPADGPVEYRSTMNHQTRGMVLHADGSRGHAGMFGTNCPFETVNGGVTGDYDLPDENETVTDAGPTVLGPETVLLTQDEVAFLMTKFTGQYSDVREVPIPDLKDARFAHDLGFVALTDPAEGDCLLSWYDADDQLSLSVHTGLTDCGGTALDADTDDGTVVLGTDDELIVVNPDGSTLTVEGGADMVVWDQVAQAWYVALVGDSGVRALETDGSLRWETSVGGAVTALEHGGAHGIASVGVAYEDGSGGLVFLDGQTGEEVEVTETPGTIDELEVAPGGDVLAVIREVETHFFDLNLDQ